MAQVVQPLVIAHFANQVDKDRSESGAACPLNLLPNADVPITWIFRSHPDADSAIISSGNGVTPLPVSDIKDRFEIERDGHGRSGEKWTNLD
ncbi:MAG: hypothetical protein IID61_07125 [SAR324 cluster bacterium]|nr:hypothetical protein [SAR324 cluster bacterium]